MSNFATTNRQLVNDTNAGSIAPPESQSSRDIGQKAPLSQQTNYDQGITQRGGHALDTMMGLADPHINQRIQEDKRKRMAEAYNTKDTRTALDAARDEQGEISKTLFGESPEIRGLQAAIKENEQNKFYSQYANDLRSGKTDNLSEKEWIQYAQDNLDRQLEGLENEPELRAEIIKMHDRIVRRTAPRHAMQHEAWKQGVAAENYKEGIRGAGNNVIANEGDNDFMTDLLFKMNQEPNQTDQSWEKLMVEEGQGLILKGVPGMFDALQQSDHWGRLSDGSQSALQNANAQRVLTQEGEGLQLRAALNTFTQEGDVMNVAETVDAMNALLPADKQMDKNAEIQKAMNASADISRVKQNKEQEKHDVLNGNAGSPEAFDGVLTDWAQQDNVANLALQLENGDITEEEFEQAKAHGVDANDTREWILNNPDKLAGLAALNPTIASNLARTALARPIAMMATAGNLDRNNPNDAFAMEEIQKAGALYDTLQKISPHAANKMVGNSETGEKLVRFKEAIDSGLDLTTEAANINAEISNNFDLPNEFRGAGGMDNLMDRMSEAVVDSVGDGILGTNWFKSISNDPAVRMDLQQLFEQEYRKTGDIKSASTRAVNTIRGNTVSLNGVAVYGMGETADAVAELGNGVSLENYLNYMVKDSKVYSEQAKEKGMYSGTFFKTADWSKVSNMSRVGDEIMLTIPGPEGEFVEDQILVLPVPTSGGQATGMTEEAFQKRQDRYRPSRVINPHYN